MTGVSDESLVKTGIRGLDEVLYGGLASNRLYLVEGPPGSGKTTLALQFLLEGVQQGERVMYVTLSETREELAASARSHGWSLDGIDVVELTPSDSNLRGDVQYTMYHPAEVELGQTINAVLDRAQLTRPSRMVFDSLSELRLLAQHPLRYRRQILSLKQFFSRNSCTVLFADDRSGELGDGDIFSIAHGVISLEVRATDYGSQRRQLHIAKRRGRPFREGWHDLRINTGGLEVFPRLISSEHRVEFDNADIGSGLPEFDELMGGGVTRGTSTLVLGPAGVGKSSIAAQYVHAACGRGERVAVFLFEELRGVYLMRTRGLGMDMQPCIDNGQLLLRKIDSAELAPGEFAQTVRHAVEDDGVTMVVIDTLNGYINAMPTEKLLLVHLHELLAYLGQRGVTTFLVSAQHGLIGSHMGTPVDTSYLADAVMLLRYYEARGELRRSVAVVKKRTGPHERTIRELLLTDQGIVLGAPLRQYRGVLSGIPVRDNSPTGDQD